MCCSNDPQCCNNKRGRFLDDEGNLLASAPTTTSTQSTTSVTSTSPTEPSFELTTSTERPSSPLSSVVAASVTPIPTDSSSSKDESDPENGEALALKVGLGLGIPLIAVIVAGAIFILIRKRLNKADNHYEQQIHENYQLPPIWSGYPKGVEPHYRATELEQRDTTHELQGMSMNRGYDGEPGELMGSTVHNEPKNRRF